MTTTAPHEAQVDVTDEETCTAFGDVLTILANAEVALQSGRMTQDERDRWYQLATRVLDRVPTSGSGAVSDGVATLKAAAPPVPAAATGARAQTAIGTPEWYAAASLNDACDGALSTWMFTGG